MSAVETARDRTQTRPARWALLGLAGVLLIESRGFVTTPEVTQKEARTPPPRIVTNFVSHKTDLLIACGVSLLGVLCLVVFLSCLADTLARRLPGTSPIPRIVLTGTAVTGAATFVGYCALALAAQAADDRVTAATFAALNATTNGLAYAGFTALAVVTGAVAVAGLRWRAVAGWYAVFSAIVTVVLAATAFLPFVSWLPGLVWIAVTSLAFLTPAP